MGRLARRTAALHADSISEERMNILAKAILRRIFHRIDTAGDLARLPAVYRNVGGGLMSHITAAGILRLALRWPGLTVVLILSAVAARLMSRRHQANDSRRVLRAP
jgi:hypothetical protein